MYYGTGLLVSSSIQEPGILTPIFFLKMTRRRQMTFKGTHRVFSNFFWKLLGWNDIYDDIRPITNIKRVLTALVLITAS